MLSTDAGIQTAFADFSCPFQQALCFLFPTALMETEHREANLSHPTCPARPRSEIAYGSGGLDGFPLYQFHHGGAYLPSR